MPYTKITYSNILVTGGAGFIGSNLCEDLLINGNQVCCLDNFSTGKRENIAELINYPGFKLQEGDIRDLSSCREAVKNADVIFHQAALGSVPRSINDPILTNDNNINGFLNMLVAARDAGVKRFIYAASSSTYGDSKILPKTEDHIDKPLSPYAVSKYVNELYAHVFGVNYDLVTVGLRYFNVFGRKQDPEGAYAAVIPKFTMQLINHTSPIINGDGTTSRDFTYINNVIQMNHLAAVSKHPDIRGQIFNTATGERNTLNQLCEYLREFLSAFDPEILNIEFIYGSERAGDIQHSHASIEKAKKILRYNPQFSFKEGLKEAVNWYWKNLNF